MPCKMCELVYVGKPCKEKRLEFKDKFVATFNKFYVKATFKTLRKTCPCMECLVKVVCFKDRFNCDSYVTLLALVNKKGVARNEL